MMETNNKNINLDAPLLSTRRFSTDPQTNCSLSPSNPPNKRSSLPFYKPDLKSGPVRNPGVVPFVWEQKPGQPKTSTGSVAVPKPPLVKLGSSVRTRKPSPGFGNLSKESSEGFEQTNNERLKEEELEVKKDESFDQHFVPDTIQAASNNRTNKEEKSNEKLSENQQKQQETQQENQESKSESKSEAKSEESESDTFSDALETLSRTESFVMNCSISGLSELQPKTLNYSPGGSDLEAHKFMMDRFLPAAQAVATGSPQYTFRKVPKGPEPGLVGTGTRRVPVPLPYQHQRKYEEEQEESESESEGEDLEASRRFQAKGCGFLPSFCMKSSFMLMNPVPALKGSGRVVQMKGGTGTGTGTVRRNGSPLIKGSINGGAGLKNSDEAFETYMHSWEPVYKHKQDQTNNSNSNNKNQNKKNETNKKNSDTSLLTYWSDSNGEDPINKAASSPFHSSRNGSRNGSSLLDPDPFLDAQDSEPKEETHRADSSMERESVVMPGSQERESVIMSGFQERESMVLSGSQERESVVLSGSQERESGVMSGFQERESGVMSGFQERERGVMSGFRERERVGFQERESVVTSGFEERESVGKKEFRVSMPLPLQVPKSPSESWLSRTLPSVSVKKQPIPSFLGMQSKKQGEERWRA